MGLLRRFFGLGDKICVIEVQPELPLGDDARASVLRLGDHPGFQWLIQMLRRHRSAMVEALKICEEKDLIRLQEGIKWASWLEKTVAHEVKLKEAHRREVTLGEREREILAKSLASIETVGV